MSARPTTIAAAPGTIRRWEARGGAGLVASADTIGVRDAARAGHHEPTTAVTTASTIAAAIAHHDWFNGIDPVIEHVLQCGSGEEPRR